MSTMLMPPSATRVREMMLCNSQMMDVETEL
jgi:hypothetical protein